MAKQRQSLSGKVVAITGRCPRDRQGDGDGTGPQGLPRRDRRPRPRAGRADRGGARRRHRRAAARRHRPRLLRRLPRRRRARARPARRRRQQRRDHAGDAVRRGVRRLAPAPARHQRLRRDRRHAAGDRALPARAATATSSTSPRRRAKAASPASPPTRAPSTPWSGSARRSRAELRGSGVEIACVMPTVVNTELTAGVGQRLIKPVEAEDVADEIVDALEVPRFDVWVPRDNGAFFKFVACCRAAPREGLGRLMKVDKLMTEVDHGARSRLRGAGRASEPGAGRRSGAWRAASATRPESRRASPARSTTRPGGGASPRSTTAA